MSPLSENYSNHFIVSGRLEGDDEDSIGVVRAKNASVAIELFEWFLDQCQMDGASKRKVLSECISVSAALNDAIGQAPALPDTYQPYLVSGRLLGDGDDSIHLVYADSIGQAQTLFEEHLCTDMCVDHPSEVIILSIGLLSYAAENGLTE
jgi:hypothetical protein